MLQVGTAALGLAAASFLFVFAGTVGPTEEDSGEVPEQSPTTVSERVETVEPVEANDESPSVDRADEESRPMPERVVRDRAPGQQAEGAQKRKEYEPAVLKVVTNFNLADVTVNGLPYPEYEGSGENDGMVLPAGGPYTVKVNYDGKSKTYTINLEPYRTRLLMVELSGFKGKSLSSKSGGGDAPTTRRHQKDDDENGEGRLTVYGKPKGQIYVDGNAEDQQTPGTITVEAGQHDVQVKFQDGEMSESKTVRVREGAQIKLFFRRED